MDVAILCGGRGTRLAGLWDGPKCLVPLGDGRPILAHILQRARKLHPRRVHLFAGHKGSEVVARLRQLSLLSPRLVIHYDDPPQGTATAMRYAQDDIKAPLLVLNGDTLPRYEFSELVSAWKIDETDVLVAQCGGLSAGATVLGARAMERLNAHTIPSLDVLIESGYLGEVKHVLVDGFLDIGTPHGFELAKVRI